MAEIKLNDISPDSLPNNSNRAKREWREIQEDKQNIKKTTSAQIVPHRGTSVIKSYVVDEVVMPNLRSSIDSIATTLISGIADSLTGIVKTCLFGEPNASNPRGNVGGYTTYRTQPRRFHPRLYEPPRSGGSRNVVRRECDQNLVDDIEFDSRREIEDCLAAASDIIEEYGRISVAKFYDICGISTVMTLNDYGWYDLANVRIRPSRGKWLLELPPSVLLD